MTIRPSVALAVCTVVLLFGFPKAGIYLGSIPITFGYLLLGLTALVELVRAVACQQHSIENKTLWLGLLLLALAGVELVAFAMYGSTSLGAMVSILVSSIVMPLVMILATRGMLRTLGLDRLLHIMRWSLAIVLGFGLLSFTAYNVAGMVVGVPFLTTTGSDISEVITRHNLRGPIVKMFSTYNNGNILGVNILMWGPLVAIASLRCAVAYRSICVLTLSRSVWVGLVAIELLGAQMEKSYARLGRAAGGLALLLIAVIIASIMIGRDPTAFLLDKDLGGRVAVLKADLEVIGEQKIRWKNESFYASSWLAFGPVGCGLMVGIWVFPIVAAGNLPIQQTSRMVLLVYLVIASAEGAFTLIPTQATYWFVATIAMCPPQMLREPQQVLDSNASTLSATLKAYPTDQDRFRARAG